jgi:hypothetical protein
MEPNRKSITPLKFCILGIRLVALLMFFSSLTYVGYLLLALVSRTSWTEVTAGPHAAILLVYAIVLLIFIRYPEPIARLLSRRIPRFTVQSRWTRIELLAAILAAVAVYEMLSGIPMLFTQLYGILTRYQDLNSGGASEKERFDLLVVGLFGSIVKICIAGLVFVNSDNLAMFWDRRQTAGGLRNSRNRWG